MDEAALDRARGALLGLACGDAVGTTLEFKAPGSFEPIDDMVGGGPFGLRAGAWTDDTSMALCLAESLLDRGAFDADDQLRRYLLWKDDGHLSSTGRLFDIGITTANQLERFRRTGVAVDPHPDQEAAANGSLMRLAPVPIRWHTDLSEAAAWSAASSRTTHPAERPVDSCRLLGAMLAALIGGASPDEVFAPGFFVWGELHPAVAAVAAGSYRRKEPPAVRGTGYCVDALEAALWAVTGAADFEQAVLRAANLGDDADTTAAIAGQLAGARWGAKGIPTRWLDRLVLRERIGEMATGLFWAGVGADRPLVWDHDDVVHAWWVQPNVLAGEYPGAPDPVRAADKVNLLLDAGVRTFVDLTEPGELVPYDGIISQAASERCLPVEHRRFPIPDLGVVDDAVYDEIVTVIADGAERGAVYVHCWGGVGRTGTVVGCLLADAGLDADGIARRIRELRHGTRKDRREAPEMAPQHEVIRRRVLSRRP